MKILYFLFLTSWLNLACLAQSKDHLAMIYLGKGSRLVLKQSIQVPANSGSLVFRFPQPTQYRDYCSLQFEPSQTDRVLSAGREIVFSGKVLQGPPENGVVMSLEVEAPQGIKSVTCRNFWDGQITIGQFRSAFLEVADLVIPVPDEFRD